MNIMISNNYTRLVNMNKNEKDFTLIMKNIVCTTVDGVL